MSKMNKEEKVYAQLVEGMYEENQYMIELLGKVDKKLVDMYNAITNGNGEAFASQDELVKEIREFLKNAI